MDHGGLPYQLVSDIKLSIIIVNWNTGELLEQCLASLFGQDVQAPTEVIVVDNASSDDSIGMLRRRFPQVVVMENSENFGFTRANNRAIEKASGEYLLLLNPDTIIPDSSTLRHWLAFMDEHREAGVSGCRLAFPNGDHQVGDAGFRPTLGSVSNYALFLSKIFPPFKGVYLNHSPRGPCEVDWVCGADLLVRRSIIADVGSMDEDIFMYADDIEWGCRIRASGYKIYYLPTLTIIHYQGATGGIAMGKDNPSFVWFDNLRSLYGLYHKGQPIVLFDILFSINFLLRGVLYHLCYLRSKDPKTGVKAGLMWQYLRLAAGHAFKKGGRIGRRVR
jgi:GT2 family glycosyltransferase